MFAEKLLRLISGIFVSAYVARYLGPSQYGLLSYVISLVGIFTSISILGLDDILQREIVKDPKKTNSLMGSVFLLRLAAAGIVYTGLVVAVQSNQTDPTTRSLIYIIGLSVVFQVFGIVQYFFQAKVWSKYTVSSQIIALVVASVFRIILVITNAPLVWFAWSTTLDYFILAIGLVVFYTQNVSSIFKWRLNPKLASYLLGVSWPLIFTSLAITIYMRFDQVMVKWMLGNEASGHYGVAVRLSEMWNFIPTAICASLFPALINAKASSEKLYMDRLQNLYDLIIGMGLSIAIAMTFLSGFLVNALFGEEFAPGANILALYIWSSVFTFMGVANGKWIIIENLQKFRMICLIIAGLLNVALTYVFIKLIGLEGAAVATLISYGFANYLFLLVIPKGRPTFVMLTRSLNLFRLLRYLRKA
jgi:O-antigen/teichoic acid export membrane protein